MSEKPASEGVSRGLLDDPFSCRVYWGSHGCYLLRGHSGPHECDCCRCPDHDASNVDEDGVRCVAKPPYYRSGTTFYGEDAE